MRVLLLVLLLAGCATTAPAEFDGRLARSIDSYFYEYLTDATQHLLRHDESCSLMRHRHDEVQQAFMFIVTYLDGYHSKLAPRLNQLSRDLNTVRAQLWADGGCIPDHD